MNTKTWRRIQLTLWFCLLLVGFNAMVIPTQATDTHDSPFSPQGNDQMTYLPIGFQSYCSQTTYFDDFSDPTSGWPITDNTALRTEYLNGEYKVATRQAGYLFLFRPPRCPFAAYGVEMDFRWDNTTGSNIGLLFGIVGDFSEYYYVALNTDDQVMQVFRRDAAGLYSVTPLFHNIPLITNGPTSNHIELSKDWPPSPYSHLTVNDYSLTLGWGIVWAEGTDVGFALSPYSQLPFTDARIDNFRVTGRPGSNAAMSASPVSSTPFLFPLP